jgi:glycerophosphoryl diester phosphodiesterase
MKYIAHRGAPLYSPENTLSSFIFALSVGMSDFEFDVHMTGNEELVVRHDYKTTGPKLEEVFGILKGKLRLNVEIKNRNGIYKGIEGILLAKIKTHCKVPFENITISSFHYPSLYKIRKQSKNINIGVLTKGNNLREALKVAQDLSAKSINISQKGLNEKTVRLIRSKGFEVYVYTVNDRTRSRQLENWGVNGVFTDDFTISQKNWDKLGTTTYE